MQTVPEAGFLTALFPMCHTPFKSQCSACARLSPLLSFRRRLMVHKPLMPEQFIFPTTITIQSQAAPRKLVDSGMSKDSEHQLCDSGKW